MDPAGRLRAAKLRATALLLVVAAVYLVTKLVAGGDTGWLGFVQAGADAGLVGGLADWFAVTALFRHPLGLPIPHTALVPRQKDQLARSLGDFVTEHFLRADLLAEQVRSQRLVGAAGGWLREPANAARVAREAASLLASGLAALEQRNVVDYVLELVRRDARRRAYAPLVGALLRRALAGNAQQPLVDLLVSRTHAYLEEHRDDTVERLGDLLDRQGFFVRNFASAGKLVDRARDILGEVGADRDHPLRAQLDRLLLGYADSLEHDRELAARLNDAVLALLDDTAVRTVVAELVGDTVTSVRLSLGDDAGGSGELTERIAALVRDLGTRIGIDAAFRDRLESDLLRGLDAGVGRYGDQLTVLITSGVARWSDVEVSQRIELAVGRDLQFIRVNGTAVGALAGIAIHAVGIAL